MINIKNFRLCLSLMILSICFGKNVYSKSYYEGYLKAGDKLDVGDSIVNGDTNLVLQDDGNLVLYCNGKPTWASGTNGKEVDHIYFQDDGNLVLKNGSNVVWAPNTHGLGIDKLIIEKDGRLAMYSEDKRKWVVGEECKNDGKRLEILHDGEWMGVTCHDEKEHVARHYRDIWELDARYLYNKTKNAYLDCPEGINNRFGVDEQIKVRYRGFDVFLQTEQSCTCKPKVDRKDADERNRRVKNNLETLHGVKVTNPEKRAIIGGVRVSDFHPANSLFLDNGAPIVPDNDGSTCIKIEDDFSLKAGWSHPLMNSENPDAGPYNVYDWFSEIRKKTQDWRHCPPMRLVD